MKLSARLVLILFIAFGLGQAAADDSEMAGVWLSPDWLFPGTRRYSEGQVRQVARQVMSELAGQGISAVFLESFLRGYSIAPQIVREHHTARVVPYVPGRGQGIPVYRHLDWAHRVEVDTVVDPLQIFIEEARPHGIAVHAWVHLFYWKMDNPEAMLSWHNGPSLWNELTVDYLVREADRLAPTAGAAPETVSLMREAAALFRTSSDARRLEGILRKHHVDPEGRPLGVLLRQAMRAGARRPEHLLIQSVEDPFPAPRGKVLRPIYVNPEDPRVRATLLRVIESLAGGHPGLAGIHLDHVRYPVDGQGLPESLGVQDGTINYYDPVNPVLLSRYETCHQILARRREALQSLVNEAARVLDPRLKLSAAVLPLYYRDRDNGRYRLCGYDFSCQDWYGWDVDFVVPMMYEFHPYLIRTLLRMFAAQQAERAGHSDIQVYPGVSRLHMARHSLDTHAWVFFDLTLARDVKLEKLKTEDLNFGAQ